MIEQIVFMHKDNLIRLDIDRQKEFKINRLKNRLDILDYEIWYSDNEEFINMELAESGADRELDFNPENEFEKRYEKYLERMPCYDMNETIDAAIIQVELSH